MEMDKNIIENESNEKLVEVILLLSKLLEEKRSKVQFLEKSSPSPVVMMFWGFVLGVGCGYMWHFMAVGGF